MGRKKSKNIGGNWGGIQRGSVGKKEEGGRGE